MEVVIEVAYYVEWGNNSREVVAVLTSCSTTNDCRYEVCPTADIAEYESKRNAISGDMCVSMAPSIAFSLSTTAREWIVTAAFASAVSGWSVTATLDLTP